MLGGEWKVYHLTCINKKVESLKVPGIFSVSWNIGVHEGIIVWGESQEKLLMPNQQSLWTWSWGFQGLLFFSPELFLLLAEVEKDLGSQIIALTCHCDQ